MSLRSSARTALAATATVVLLAGCGSSSTSTSTGAAHSSRSASAEVLTGLFRLTPGTCTGSAVSGSYFRMIQPHGSTTAGPFVSNGDSTCATKTYSLLRPGTAGGLLLGRNQPMPTPAFSATGGGLADAIVAPTPFFAVAFAIATPAMDPATHQALGVPELRVGANGQVSGQITCWTAAYNNAYYNQGAPKPGGGTPGDTSAGVSGHYDAATGALTITWTSEIVGGAFGNFSGFWHLTGVLVR